ncbi:unnamed protein product [Ixodes pacificus]
MHPNNTAQSGKPDFGSDDNFITVTAIPGSSQSTTFTKKPRWRRFRIQSKFELV